MANHIIDTTCCVVGGGPAGMMLGYLLAREGVPVAVLEKHNDFFRDFRGDTVHPSTLELFHELGLLDEFLKLPHQTVEYVSGILGDFEFRAADFRRLPSRCKFTALMPQWDFLEFLSAHAKKFPAFDLRMQHEAIDLVREDGRITGVMARTPHETVQIRADLVVGCDGRHSTVRTAAGLQVQEFGVPMDVLWFRISRKPDDPEELFGNINYGKALVLINRSEYFQAGLIVRKGSFEEIKARGLGAFQEEIARIAPYLRDRVQELHDWDQLKLLTVQVNRLRRWHRPGLLCIGDAAHAMSPAGGVGINLAIQDAVATANLLARALREKRVTEANLAAVQQRRELPTRVTQFLQVNAHKGMSWIFEHQGPIRAPWQLKAAVQIPGIQRVIGHVVGIGVRPEHIVQPPKRRVLDTGAWRAVAAGVAVAVAAVRIIRGLRHRRERAPALEPRMAGVR